MEDKLFFILIISVHHEPVSHKTGHPIFNQISLLQSQLLL